MYTLLTGATGLLGSYLLRDLLCRDHPVVVLARGSRFASAAERIDLLLKRWEDNWQRSLPRPVVLEAELTSPDLGLSDHDLSWVRQHCDRMIHSAASLVFYEKDGEPWSSNVEGVRHVLDFCDQTEIRELNHISSAYTCGLRSGVVLESELDVGQKYGNDYEISKVQAEQLVRDDSRLAKYRIFRPSIIVGDSETGFTTSYHGFYTPLRLVMGLADRYDLTQLFDLDILGLLGMAGHEGKNLVPVNWVSDAILTVMDRQPADNRAYAIVAPEPVTSDTLKAVIRSAVERNRDVQSSPPVQTAPITLDSADDESLISAFSVYRSYWRDDPTFDARNTLALLPDKPCPTLTADILNTLCDVAVEAKFSVPQAVSLKMNGRPTIKGSLDVRDGETLSGNLFRLTVTGTGGGSWNVCPRTQIAQSVTGSNGSPTMFSTRMNANTFLELAVGKTTVPTALACGRIVLQGQGDSSILSEFFTATAAKNAALGPTD